MNRLFVRLVVVGVVALSGGALVATPAQAKGGGVVLPARARPHGFSLSDMTKELALFSTSGNNAAFLPHTPFQVLYGDPATITFTPEGSGLVESGTNTFAVHPGTMSFVPVFNVDDSPPVIGSFPTSNAQAKQYFLDPQQVGGKDFTVTVDGSTTSLGASYVAGPVTTPPLGDGGGTHMITLGVFLTPLPPGHHTISISGGVFGAALQPAVGISFLRESFTYTVNVR
jgi:hypothetical protein